MVRRVPSVGRARGPEKRSLLDLDAPDDDHKARKDKTSESDPVGIYDSNTSHCQKAARIAGVAHDAVGAFGNNILIGTDVDGKGEVLSERPEKCPSQHGAGRKQDHADNEDHHPVAHTRSRRDP